MTEPSDEISCHHCKLAIPAGAKVCTHCHGRQDWWRWLGVSQTTLALLVALISVSAAIIPVVSSLFNSGSDVVFSRPVIDGDRMRMIVTNNGTDPGAFDEAIITSELLGTLLIFKPDEGTELLIRPGSQVLEGRLALTMNPETALDWVRVNESQLTPDLYDGVGRLSIKSVSADGSEVRQYFGIRGWDFVKVLQAHVNRCIHSGAEPTMANGCVNLEDVAAGESEANE